MPDHGGQNSTRITIDTVVRGTVETRGDLLVEGRVEGRVRCEGTLLVAGTGACLADVHARCAHVLGEVLGNVTCHQAISVAAGGRVVGDLRAPDVAVDGDASVSGRIDLLPPAATGATGQRVPVTASTGSPTTRRPPRRPVPGEAPGEGPAPDDAAPGSAGDRAMDFRARPPRALAGDATTDVGEPQRIPRPPRPRGRVHLANPATTS